MTFSEIPAGAYSLFGAVVGSAITFTATILAQRSERAREKIRLQEVKAQLLFKERADRLSQFAIDLGAAAYSFVWLTWSAENDDLDKKTVEKYWDEIQRTMPRLYGGYIMVAGLDDELGIVAKALIEKADELDMAIGKALLNLNRQDFERLKKLRPKSEQFSDDVNNDIARVIFVHRGDRVCVFLRFLSADHGTDEVVEAIVWPQDMSGFIWKDGGLSALFDRKLLVVQLDKPDRDPNDLLTDPDKAAVEAPISECPKEDDAPIKVKVPQPGDDPKNPTTWPDDPSKWGGTQTLFVYQRCVVFPDRHWVAPRLLGGSHAYFFAGSAPGAAQAQRYARKITKTKLPSSALTCPINSTLREYRFKLDIASLKQVAPITVDQDTRRPEALGAPGVSAPAARPPIARSRMVVSLVGDGHVEPVPTRVFTVNIAGQSSPVVITDAHLSAPLPLGATMGMNGPYFLNAQVARHLPNGAAPAPGDARNAFYVEFKESDPKNINDDGFRIYPLDRVGYIFCAPDQAEVEIAALIDNVAPNDDRGDQLLASGACGTDSRGVCPIVGVTAHFGARLPADARDIAVPIFAPRRSPIDVESYRGWGSFGITSEFLEPTEIDSGTPLENPGVPLSTTKAPKAETPELLPTVRDFNRLRIRLAKRQGPIAVSGVAQPEGSAALQNGPCDGKKVTTQQCVRDNFLSQVRVHVLTGSYRDHTDQQPSDWIYCIDNGRRRPKNEPEAAAVNAGDKQLPARRLQSRVGVDTGTPHFCSIGTDAGLWVSDDFMSASRLGRKDLVNPVADTLAAYAASTAATPDASGGHLVHLLPRVSTTTSEGTALAGWGAGSSNTKTNTAALADVFDLNGDGFPDQIVGNDPVKGAAGSQVFFTDPAGRFRCLVDEVWAKRYPCVMPSKPVVPNAPVSITNQFSRKSFGSTSGLSVGFSSPKTFITVHSNASGKTGVGSIGTQPTQAQSSRDPIMVPLSPAAEFSRGQSYRRSEMIDLNGDGLPDLIPDESNTDFNFGFDFIGRSGGWKNGLMEEESNGIGLSAGLGYGDDIEEYGGGLSVTSSRSRQKRLMADVNGDGLLDVVRVSGNNVLATLNTGFGFEEKNGKAVERRVGILAKPLDALGQGESDGLGANAYYSYSIPIYLVFWTIYIIVNPGASLGASLNRQVIALRDFDADGLADLMVGGGVNVGGNLNLNFDNRSAVVYRNPFGKHGLLTHVFLASNPESLKTQPDFSRANFVLDYGRSAPSENDPQSRWILNEVIVRDGVAVDDAGGVHDRRTCYTFEQGFFDRFERKFLGFAKVTTVEGCTKPGAQRPLVELGPNSDRLTGIRKIERTYANRSVYESGILLSETTKDISSPGIVAAAGSPTRTVENTYVLFDVGRSSGTRQECFGLEVSDGTNAADGRPFMRPMLTEHEGGRIAFPNVTRNNIMQGPCHSLPAFDRGDTFEVKKGQYLYGPQRLTPVLVQSVGTLTEGDATKFTTAMQFAIDYRGRVARACDLGRLGDPKEDASVNEDDVCSKYEYDDRIQLSFIHGATGGGTLAFDRRDRVQRIDIWTGKQEPGTRSPDRLRTAKYDPNNGDLVALCQFENPKARDLCSETNHFPLRAEELRLGSHMRVAVRHYHYDEFGNLDRYVSPVAADGHFLSRRIGFDNFLHVVEVREDSDYCAIDPKAATDSVCLVGSTSALGTFTSRLSDVDWRHAVATTQIDVNKNAIRTVLDGAGRPTAVFASWAGKWAKAPDCKRGECVSAETANALKPSASWGKLLAYEYRVPHDIVNDVKVNGTVMRLDQSSAVVRITRFADAALYKRSGDASVGAGSISFDIDQHFDQLGRLVRTIAPADICIPETETPDGATCDPSKRGTHTASGIIRLDAAEREVEAFMPAPVNALPALDLASVVAFPNESTSPGLRTTIISDGLDRPLHVRLSDGNSYAFKYQLADDNNVVRHRTIIRDAQCVPTAMDRDERGLIRAVHEFVNAGAGGVFDAHAVGSSFNRSDKSSIIAAGWVKDIDYTDAHQQTVTCVKSDANAPGIPGPAIVMPLTDPLLDSRASRRSSTVYDYDAFSQLVGIHLPNSTAVVPTTPIVSGSKGIRVTYDALGRRSQTNDPDRGFEQLSYDLLSNLVCHRSGPPAASAAFTDTVNLFQKERQRRTVAGTEQRLEGEDVCLAPEAPNVSRVVRNEYVYDRLSKVLYRHPSPVDGSNKTVAIEYGRFDDVAANRAGRQVKLMDVTGVAATVSYHPLGMPDKIEKAIRAMARAPLGVPTGDIGNFATTHSYDSWGLLHRSVLRGAIKGIRNDGTNDDNPGNSLTVSETVRYRYSPADQINEVLVGPPCPAAADGKEVCANVLNPTRVLTDAAFDERGNTLRLAFGNTVVTRNEFDVRSNRLLSSSSRLGVPCVEYGPGDDCANRVPPILFQNLSYAYDAAGNLTEYGNRPRYADLCGALPAGQQCPEISRDHARLQGLLAIGSKNLFAYDERSRLKSAQKEVSVFGQNYQYSTIDDADFSRAKKAEIKINELFAFADSHLLTGIQRSVAPEAFDQPSKTTITHTYGAGRATAPDTTAITLQDRNEQRAYHLDDFGRIDSVRCSDCFVAPGPDKRSDKVVTQSYTWDPDDTLAMVRRRIEPPPTEDQRIKLNRDSRYFANVNQTYDYAGNRAIKRWIAEADRPTGRDRKLLRETVYVDERVTVTREPNQKPEALLHVFAGSMRLASKWIGSKGIFTYHAHLPTRTVSDVVYARGDDRTTARLHQQFEYASFGQLLFGRESVIPQANRDPPERPRLTGPLYRFDAKEYDSETNLTYFGARHYNQRLGFWLSPDPELPNYLTKVLNGGVFAPKNLSAYGFGWGNPIRHSDVEGRYPIEAYLGNQVLGPLEIESIPTHTLYPNYTPNLSAPKGENLSMSLRSAENMSWTALAYRSLPTSWTKTIKLPEMSVFDVKAKGSQYEKYGNFAFGARAAAARVPLEYAVRAGGPIQETLGGEKRTLQQRYKEFIGPFPFGDDPKDVGHIIEGYRYYQATQGKFFEPSLPREFIPGPKPKD
jgi:RHS repeat-associated protein